MVKPMKKYANYNHLRKCEIGRWQGIFGGNRFDKNVVEAIEYIQSTIGIRRVNADIFTAAYSQLLTDFLFHKVRIPENKGTRLRVLKNKLKLGRRVYAKDWVRKNEKYILELLDLLKHPLREEGEGEIPVGPFTLKNPIRLSDDKVEVLESACKKALRLCTNSLAPNFTQALYGDVILAEKIGRANWYAWYNGTKDEITIKYMDREEKGFMKTFIHEIGHRYYQKILPKDKKNLWRIYDSRCHYAQRINLSDWIGKDINLYVEKTKRGTYIGSEGDQKAYINEIHTGGVMLKFEDETISGPYKVKFITEYIKAQTGIFPTRYAMTDVEEHFCEALAYKAIGDLHPKSLDAFNSIIVDGKEYNPNGDNFTQIFDPSKQVEETQVEETLPSKLEMARSCESLASRLGILFNKGRKYGKFIYTNDAVGSTHAYMFIDYSTGNLFAPKAHDAPNLKVNIGNITDDNLDMNVGFERMSDLRPRWRTMNVISESTKKAPTTEIIDQTPEPTLPTTPEGNLVAIRLASELCARNLGLEFQEMRKFLRLIYTNPKTSTKHSYLFVDKQNGSIHPPKAHDAPKKAIVIGSILEPNIISKIDFEAMKRINANWQKQYVIRSR
jgi:hypothetical protein